MAVCLLPSVATDPIAVTTSSMWAIVGLAKLPKPWVSLYTPLFKAPNATCTGKRREISSVL